MRETFFKKLLNMYLAIGKIKFCHKKISNKILSGNLEFRQEKNNRKILNLDEKIEIDVKKKR